MNGTNSNESGCVCDEMAVTYLSLNGEELLVQALGVIYLCFYVHQFNWVVLMQKIMRNSKSLVLQI